MKPSRNYPKTKLPYRRLYPEEIRKIHLLVIKKDGGLQGEKDPGMINYISEKPFQEYFGVERYPTIFEKASVIFDGIATGHYFVDGNKRTAVMSLYVFLGKNGYDLNCSQEELFKITLKVANKKINLSDLTAWIKENSLNIKY